MATNNNNFLNDMLHKVTDAIPDNLSDYMNVGNTERMLSVAGGAVLAYFGAQHIKSPAGIAMASAAAPLLFRGLSGYCPVNQAIGRDTAHAAKQAEGWTDQTKKAKQKKQM